MNLETSDKVFHFKTNALAESLNKYEYAFFHKNGQQQKGKFEILALKDRKLSTWWDGMNYPYLNTVPILKKIVIPTTDRPRVIASTLDYNNKNPKLIQIEGVYGTIFPLYDKTSLKLQSILVSNGTIQFVPISLEAVKNDILQAFPDCVVTQITGGYILNSSSTKFSFSIVNNGVNVTTEITKIN